MRNGLGPAGGRGSADPPRAASAAGTGRRPGTLAAALGLSLVMLAGACFVSCQSLHYFRSFSVAPEAMPAARLPVPSRPSAPAEGAARRLFFVLVDGLGASAAEALPELGRLGARGGRATLRVPFPTFSGPNYYALFSGIPPRDSGARVYSPGAPWPHASLVSQVRRAGSEAVFFTEAGRWFRPEYGFARVEVEAKLEPLLAQAAARPLRPGGPELVVAFINVVDTAGHHAGARSAAYARAARKADALIGWLAERLDLRRDALLITADHGHTARGGHGGPEPEVAHVPLVLVGRGVRAGSRTRAL